jgi:ligand-binding sensor domain-containing protein
MFRSMTRSVVILGCSLAMQPHPARAQTWEVFDMATAGFPSDNITDIVQDSQGIIWAATSWGLCRYDGTDWTVYQTGTTGLPDNVIRSLAIDSLDRVWIGTQLHGISVFDGASWETIDMDDSPLPDNEINSLTIDHRGWAWIGTYLGLVCYTGDEWRFYNTSDTSYNGLQLNGNTILHTAVRPDGLVALGTLNGGFHYITDTSITVHTTFIDQFPDNTQNEVAFDLVNNERWLATPSQGLLRQGGPWYEGPWFQYTTGNSLLPSNAVNCVRVDGQARVWLGTLLAGLAVRGTDGAFTNYTSSNSGLPDNTVQCVMVATDGSIWAGTAYGGLARLSFSEVVQETSRPTFNLYPNPCEGHVFFDRGGNVSSGRWLIIDPSGRTVRDGGFSGSGVMEIPLLGLAPACYTFVTIDPQGRTARKLQVLP